MKTKIILIAILFSSCLYSQTNQSPMESVKSKVFFYGFTFENEVKENYVLSIPTSLLANKNNQFSVYDSTSNLNTNYYMEGSNYVVSNTTQIHQNNFSSIKKDSFNPHGAYSVETALGLGLITTVFDLLLK